jgi:hypothetical protein
LTDGIVVTSTSSKDAIKAIQAGEDATVVALPSIRQKLAEMTARMQEQKPPQSLRQISP